MRKNTQRVQSKKKEESFGYSEKNKDQRGRNNHRESFGDSETQREGGQKTEGDSLRGVLKSQGDSSLPFVGFLLLFSAGASYCSYNYFHQQLFIHRVANNLSHQPSYTSIVNNWLRVTMFDLITGRSWRTRTFIQLPLAKLMPQPCHSKEIEATVPFQPCPNFLAESVLCQS